MQSDLESSLTNVTLASIVVGACLGLATLMVVPYCTGSATQCSVTPIEVVVGVLSLLAVSSGLLGHFVLTHKRSRSRRHHQPDPIEVRLLGPEEWATVAADLEKLEEVFAEELRDSPRTYHRLIGKEGALFLIATVGGRIIGLICGAPLETFPDIPGVKQDPHYGIGDTFYILSHSVAKDYQGRGIGRTLMRALLSRIKMKGIRYAAAHVRQGFAAKWNALSLRIFRDWYGSGTTFEYYRRELTFGNWTDGCRSMILVEAILGGFSAVVLTLIASNFTAGILAEFALLGVLVAVVFLAQSAEQSTDAVDRGEPTKYATALLWYNFGVVALFLGLAAFVFQLSYSPAPPASLGQYLLRGGALFVGAFAGYFWLWDGLWLLFPENRLEFAASLEFGETV